MTDKTSCLILLFILLPGLSACSDDDSVASEPTGVIPLSQLDALESASAISDLLQQAEEEKRKQMEEQGI